MGKSRISKQTDRVDSLLSKPNLDPDVFDAIVSTMQDVRMDLSYIEDEERGYERYLVNYLSTFEATDDNPACECPSPRCEIKQGQLPYGVRPTFGGDLDSHLDEFIASHPNPNALIEARESWMEMVSGVQTTLDKCASAARKNSTDPLPSE